MAAKNPKIAERVVELCVAAPEGGELRELCYRWSVQRLPDYPQDKAKAEEEYWIQRDVERMNNRTSAMAANRGAGGWWGKLRGNGKAPPAPLLAPSPPPFDWKSFPWAEDPDENLPDSEVERIERLEEKAMLEEGKAEEEGWDSGPEGGGVAGTEAAAVKAGKVSSDEEEGGEGMVPDKKSGMFPPGTRWGATDKELEEAE